jgi:hypothetical protein
MTVELQNDREAFCLARTYNLVPRRHLPYFGTHNYDTGMYEPDHVPEADVRTIVLAHIIDKTNILIKYNPDLILIVPYHAAGTLTPNAAGNYNAESGYNDELTWSNDLRTFFLWWDDVDSWIISYAYDGLDKEYWKKSTPGILGDYEPYGGASGVATILQGPE